MNTAVEYEEGEGTGYEDEAMTGVEGEGGEEEEEEDFYDEEGQDEAAITAEIERVKAAEEQLDKQTEGAVPGGQAAAAPAGDGTPGAAAGLDENSIHVGQVDYEVTPEELQAHFDSCGTINRVTILCDKFGQPKGFAYVEFLEKASVEKALKMDNSMLKGRPIKVTRKRVNVHGFNRGGRGRGGFRGRGFPRGRGGFRPRGRGYRGGFRGGYRGYSPYY